MVDLLPAQTRRWQVVEAVARAHFQRSGLAEIRTPLLEVTELFARGIGEGKGRSDFLTSISLRRKTDSSHFAIFSVKVCDEDQGCKGSP